MSGHDSIYRRFFSHPEMVLDLLRRFVGGEWVQQLEPGSLEMLPAHYVAEELEQREQDLVWKVRYDGDRSFFVYLLLEFQSTVDRFMALRLLVYLGLLYQDLEKQGDLTAEGLLPPVLPLVLYNGDDAWWAKTELADLIDSGVPELSAYHPRFRYQVIDEVHLPLDLLAVEDSPVAGMIRIERSRNPYELRDSVLSLLAALKTADLNRLTPDVETWLRRIVGPKRFRDLDLKSWKELTRITTMVEERMRQWEEEVRAEELAKGLEKGLEKGRAEGRAETLRSTFHKMFRLKFHRDLSEAESERLDTAEADTFETLLEGILTAEDPADLLN